MARTRDPEVEAARKAQVADAAIALLAAGSWRGVTLSAVASQAGVSKGVVTYWFKNKDALILAAIHRHHARYEAELAQIATAPTSARDRLAALIHAAFPDPQTVSREVAFQAEVWSYAKTQPEAHRAILDAYSRFQIACEALLALGVEEGFVTATDTDGLYRFIHALIDGLSIQVAFDPDVDLPALRARLVETLEAWLR